MWMRNTRSLERRYFGGSTSQYPSSLAQSTLASRYLLETYVGECTISTKRYVYHHAQKRIRETNLGGARCSFETSPTPRAN